ncbi:class D beta-lactamase [Pelobacter seleniigenes]|uniref:class D beta-lactamase n=1 Tax=Pelobacter seleniigenes TaxID=407188 RepID=UPI0004A755E2|nr:class D beta-lactamase [Pelobacter seleniigenes]
MKHFQTIFGCLVVLTLTIFIVAPSYAYADDAGLANLFQDRGVEGTIVISSLDGKMNYIHNSRRSETRFIPASTFKIPNTLIALEEGAVKNENEVIAWDGKDKGFNAWNRDQTLKTAFPVSCVWFYQELARRVGNQKYLAHLKKLEYGNEKTGPDVSTFWLEGDLKISAKEQIVLLKKLYAESLPYDSNHIKLLKKMMIVEENPQFTIRAKTGWAMGTDSQQGWYVGYVETKGNIWFFATNLEIRKKGDATFRKEITMAALKAKGILK